MSAWQTLGLEPTEDQRAIKRAYAAKLKLIRPADDPEGFQRLREARDEAIFLSEFAGEIEEDAYEHYEDDDQPNVPVTADAASPALDENSDQDWLAAISPENTPSSKPAHDNDDENDDEEPPADAAGPDGPAPLIDGRQPPSEPASIPAPITTVADPDPEIGAKGRARAVEVTAEHNSPAAASTGSTLTLDDVDSELNKLMGPWNRWEKQRWARFIAEIRESPFEISAYAERQILYALSEIIVPLTPRSSEERDNQHFILSYLDEEFGWRQNDRRVYNVLSDKEAMQLMDFLRDRLYEKKQRDPTSYYDAAGFPILMPDDFRAYLGKSDTIYERYYRQCRDNGRVFRPAWSWVSFLFAPLWLAHRCNDGLEALVGIAYTIALVLIVYAINNEGSALLYVGLAILAGLHVLIGVYGKRLVISTMATALTELEMDLEMSDEEKSSKLKKLGQGGSKAIFELILGNFGIAVILIVILAIFTGG